MSATPVKREALLRLLDGGMAQFATAAGLVTVVAEPDDPWVPLERVDPRKVKATFARLGQEGPDEVFINAHYQVFVKHQSATGDGPESGIFTYLSVKRHDRAAVHNWRHLQQIKNEICGAEREGYELYPAESRLADNANQYHLYVMPEGVRLPFGFPEGMILLDDEDVAAFNANGDKGRQEPLQPGLTIGDALHSAAFLDPRAEELRQAVIHGKAGLS